MSVRRSTAEIARANATAHLAARAVATPFVVPPGIKRTEREEDAGVLFVRGNIDLHVTPTLREQFREAILGAQGSVVLDCSAMTNLDPAAIELLVELRQALCARGDQLALRALGPDEARAIDRLGLTSMLRTEGFVPTEELPSIG